MQQKKIVILENNHDTAEAVAECLRGEGFEVCGETDDGDEGVALIERTKPDVVLIGLVLKGLDGFGVMDALREMLAAAARLLCTGGRLSVITYHSIEDRIVKNMIKSGNAEGRIEQDFFGRRLTPFRPVDGRLIVPSAEEQAANPRSRSAKLRIAEKI